MKNKFALSIVAICVASGCAINRPLLTETITSTNGIVTTRSLRMTSYTLWPATSSLDKQRASIGKTMSAGTAGLDQESGGTNVVDALRAIDSILGRIK